MADPWQLGALELADSIRKQEVTSRQVLDSLLGRIDAVNGDLNAIVALLPDAAAGAIPFARTNLPDFGLRMHTHSWLRGLTRNPRDPAVTAGGSSGGEASALASGMSPLGLGNDIGGSLRNPAHCRGIASQAVEDVVAPLTPIDPVLG